MKTGCHHKFLDHINLKDGFIECICGYKVPYSQSEDCVLLKVMRDILHPGELGPSPHATHKIVGATFFHIQCECGRGVDVRGDDTFRMKSAAKAIFKSACDEIK